MISDALISRVKRTLVGSATDGREALAKLLANPILGACSTVLAVLAGVTGSVYPEQIRDSLHFVSPDHPFVFWATAFWVMVIVFALLFAGSQWGTLTLAESGQTRLGTAVAELRALPERGFLALFEENYSDAYEAARFVAQDARKEELALSVRVVLESIVSLVVKYDRAERGYIYAANVMVYRDIKSLKPSDLERVRDSIRFTEQGTALEHYAGVLELVPELSTTTAIEKAVPDPVATAFALPVPVASVRNNRDAILTDVLPGAPTAYFYNRAVVFRDYSEMARVLDDVGDFTPSLKKKIETYFLSEAASHIGSFASVPLYPKGERSEAGARPIGVLNIHRNGPGILASGFSEMFVPLSTPFRGDLTQLLCK